MSTPLDVKVGRIRVRCYEAATRDMGDAPSILGMAEGDLILHFKGHSFFYVVPAAERGQLAAALSLAGGS